MPSLVNLRQTVWIPLLLFCLLWGFRADGMSQEDEQLGEESDKTVLERHCQLVITVVYPRVCRPLCSTGAVWAFWGDPRSDRFISREFWCGLFTTCLTTTATKAAEGVILHAYRDNTWFGSDSFPGTRQDGALPHQSYHQGVQLPGSHTGQPLPRSMRSETADLATSFQPTMGRRFVSTHPAGIPAITLLELHRGLCPGSCGHSVPRDTPHQECKCSRRYASHVAQKD